MKLSQIAHARTGDKGEISNISVIPFCEAHYIPLMQYLTADRVKEYFKEICQGDVTRYELPGVSAMNFVLDKTLGGGVTRSLALDKHGKTLGMALLDMDIPDSLFPDSGTSGIAGSKAQTPPISTAYHITPPLTGNSIRIGSGAGYAGDRIEPAIELIEKGNLDYIIFECLAERTIGLGQQEKQKDSSKGYNHLLEYRMAKILPAIAAHPTKIITNMGAANPVSAAQVVRQMADSFGLTNLKIACVTGDDIFHTLSDYPENIILETGKKLSEFEEQAISANAYMGAEGIVKALQMGADIVITGRVSDPALTIGPLICEFGWDIQTSPDQIGQGILAGHLLECAGQVTGGYYADPGIKDVPDLARLGFPLIEICENGSFFITKVDGSGGLVSTDTCKEQMIYEIHNPTAYMTPDAIADFSHVQFTQIGDNCVMATGATSHGKPDSLKVSVCYHDCYIGEGEISYGGSNAFQRAKLAADIVQKRFELSGVIPDELRIDYIGCNSLYRDSISSRIANSNPVEVRLRISGRTKDPEMAEQIGREVETLYTNGPAGGGGATARLTAVLSVCSIFVPRNTVRANVQLMQNKSKLSD